ncbi:winged helix-turn-helix transcriptional regulator [Methanolobus sediminis]|uniref:Winged helix-turn-helix transcriptional regulator n=1 Tax=Methanolobus sediminis TaxID=3072978 RepID=A0AA51YLJ0_9EURY|nr:winged helix-turn-helix transcriptional regulator [Methanolobus sediminis]WMW25034.1 winged helix-turn-helix transcriptional regulator [Methanolobus sediminis]
MEVELETRKRIYELIRDSPGVHLRELTRRLDIVIGSLQYNLYYMEKKNMIYSIKDEDYVRYFVKDRKFGKNERNILFFLRRTPCRHILINLLQNGTMNNKELSDAVDLSPSTVSWHLNKLAGSGIITKEKVGRVSNFTVADPELVAELLILYKESFLDSLLDSFIDMWELDKKKR